MITAFSILTPYALLRARIRLFAFTCSLSVAVIVLTSCEQGKLAPFSIQFEADNLPHTQTHVLFYLHDIHVLTATQQKIPLQLADNQWQSKQNNIALVNLSTNASPNGNSQVRGLISPEAFHNIDSAEQHYLVFQLGVPEHLNHSNPLQTKAPLDYSEMYWSWQQGYKFLRIDVNANNAAWAFHLGSTGCLSPSPLRPPATPCKKPNRSTIRLPLKSKGISTININVMQLHSFMQQSQAACSGNYHSKTSCTQALHLLGLDEHSGQCTNNCSEQGLFSIQTTGPTSKHDSLEQSN